MLGHPDAFTTLYRRHWQDLVAYCRPRLDRADDAEDAAHEALLRAFRALPEVRDDEPMWPWLATIAANVCFDMRRRARRLSSADAVAPDPTGLLAPDVHEAARERLRADLLHRALRRLPPAARRLLVLREYGGWTYEEIARTEGTSVASVRSRLMRSRRRLGHRVEEVARVERQWPLPVAWLRRRVRAVRDWTERLVHTVGGVDAAAFLHGLGTGAQAAVVLVAAVVIGTGAPRTEAHGRVVSTSVVGVPSVPGTPHPTPRGRWAPGNAASASVSAAVARPLSTRTLRLDPPRPAVRDYATPTEESTTTVEDHEDWFYVTFTPPYTPVTGAENQPHEAWVSCAKSEARRIACAVARQALEEVPE